MWTPDAEDLLEIFIASAEDPELLVRAARSIDDNLFHAPKSFGESRYELMRIGFSRPLAVQFEVMDDVRTVIVHHVWRVAPR